MDHNKTQLGEDVTIYQGDVREVLSGMADGCVQCVITSPPYWGLRDYGVEGQLGLEKTPEEYVEKMVKVFRGVKRVLRDDGVCWLNMGDSYCNAKGKAKNPGGRVGPNACFHSKHKEAGVVPLERPNIGDLNNPGWLGLKPKDLCGIPWRLAFALQADGWYLRQDIIWHKPNPMPESVTDRCTKAHEYVFLLTKRAKYYYDAEAIKEEADPTTQRGTNAPNAKDVADGYGMAYSAFESGRYKVSSRNRRSVWTIPTQAFHESHFAVFPEKLVEPMILAGTSEKGCCPQCGAPWERMVERGGRVQAHWEGTEQVKAKAAKGKHGATSVIETGSYQTYATIGWRPGCGCGVCSDTDLGGDCVTNHSPEPIPCTVLDPFSGAGTVALVAYKHGRKAIGIELSQEYVDMSARRIKGVVSGNALLDACETMMMK